MQKAHCSTNDLSRMSLPRAFLPAVAVSLLFGCWVSSRASAHEVEITRVETRFDESGRFAIDMIYDVNAFFAGVRPEHMTNEDVERVRHFAAQELELRREELREYVRRRVRVRFDDTVTPYEIAFPDVDPVLPPKLPSAGQPDAEHATEISRIVRLTGEVPEGAEAFVFWASRTFGNLILEFVDADGRLLAQQRVEKGDRSRPYDLTAPPTPISRWEVAWDYAVLGFEHILPEGPDHILFVLGLFLLSTRLGPLVWQITAFTIAHSVTLAMSTYGVFRLAPEIVEPLIALSIVCVAVENLFTSKLHPWRPAVVFLFGLLHGLGFAGVLEELGLPRDRFVTALVSFNVGVELGQLAVIGLALVLVGWARNRPWYRGRIVIPASLFTAGVGLYWSVERVGLLG